MTIWTTRSLAIAATALLAGCVTEQNYNSRPSDNGGYNNPYVADRDDRQYDNGPSYDSAPVGQYNDQYAPGVGYDSFRARLSPYGRWTYDPRWGDVWQPRAGRDFRPYYNGYWGNTVEYGWLWNSNDRWGDITDHYGRWVFDPRDGWFWVPGYVWGPSWVVWRSGGGAVGWFPMPPDNYSGNGAYAGDFDNQYGYRDWYGPSFGGDSFLSLWIFVGEDRFGDRDFRTHVLPQRDYGRYIRESRDTTNYITINNYVVNRSIDVDRLERNTHQRFQPLPARNLLGHDAAATPFAFGRQIERREREQRPIPVNINPADRQPDRGERVFNGPRENGPAPRDERNPRGNDRGEQNPFAGRFMQDPRPPQNADVPQQRNNPAQPFREPQNADAPRQDGPAGAARGFRGRPPNEPGQPNAQIERAPMNNPAGQPIQPANNPRVETAQPFREPKNSEVPRQDGPQGVARGFRSRTPNESGPPAAQSERGTPNAAAPQPANNPASQDAQVPDNRRGATAVRAGARGFGRPNTNGNKADEGKAADH
jgi:hypothetical protein